MLDSFLPHLSSFVPRFTQSQKGLFLYILIALILILVAGGTAASVIMYTALQRVTVGSDQIEPTVPTATPKPWVDAFNQLEPYSILLLGYGGGGHDGGQLTDTVMLLYIIPQSKQIFLIAIPRDTWVALPTTTDTLTNWKINAAYPIGLDDRTYPHKPAEYTGEAGGGRLAKHTVQMVTGIPVDAFIAVDFAGFLKAVDALGGITVQVERTFDDELYPIEELKNDSCGRSEEDIAAITATMSATQIESNRMFPCRYETLHFEAGQVTMDSEMALKFARSRHSPQDGGDFNRAARQKQVLLAIRKKVLAVDFFPKILPLVSQLSYNMRTDIASEKMQEFLKYHDDLSTYSVTSIALTTQNVLKQGYSSNGQFVLLPQAGENNWQETHQWIAGQIRATETASDAAVLERNEEQ